MLKHVENIVENIVGDDDAVRWDDYFMSISLLASTRSKCARLKVGCVLVKDNRVVSTGYNGFLPGEPHESIVVDDREQATVHAEHNAVADAAKRGVSLDGSIAYVTHYPCMNCAKLLAASGVRVVKYNREYRKDPLVERVVGRSVLLEPMRDGGPR